MNDHIKHERCNGSGAVCRCREGGMAGTEEVCGPYCHRSFCDSKDCDEGVQLCEICLLEKPTHFREATGLDGNTWVCLEHFRGDA